LRPPAPPQDLHCGIFEKVEADADAYSGSESDVEDPEPLRLPPTQTVAVARAKAAGRTLIAEVGAPGEAGQAPDKGATGAAPEDQPRGVQPTRRDAEAAGAVRPKRSSKRACADVAGGET
jgi:hypothetical protein